MHFHRRLEKLEERLNPEMLVVLLRSCGARPETADGIYAASIVGREPPCVYRSEYADDEDFWRAVNAECGRMTAGMRDQSA